MRVSRDTQRRFPLLRGSCSMFCEMSGDLNDEKIIVEILHSDGETRS